MAKVDEYWSTLKEKEFLRNLGTGRFSGAKKKRKELLKLYLAAAEKRDEWAFIDGEEAVRFAQEQLELAGGYENDR